MKRPSFDYKYYVNILLMCLLAFAGGYVTSPHLGKFSSFMFLVPIAAACGFLRINIWVKALTFAACGYLLNSFYSGGMARSASCAALCGVFVIICSYAAELILTKKAARITLGAFMIMLTFFLHAAILGSPFAAVKSENAIREYADREYGETFEISGLKYDIENRRFYAELTPRADLSRHFEVWYENGRVHDGCRDYVLKTTMGEARSALVSALRARFPDDGFDVVSEKTVNAAPGAAVPQDMVFSVYIHAYVDDAEFVKRARAYAAAARDAGAEYAYLVFYGGRAGSYYRTVTLRGRGDLERCAPEFINPVKPERFFSKLFGVRLVNG